MTASVLPSSNKTLVPNGNLPFGKDDYHYVMPNGPKDLTEPEKEYWAAVYARRRARLLDLIEIVGGQKEAVATWEMNQGLISQLSQGKKTIGEALARTIEQAAKKPLGWLDMDEQHGKRIPKHLPQDEYAKQLWAIWSQLSSSDRRALYERAAGWLQRRDADTPEKRRRAGTFP